MGMLLLAALAAAQNPCEQPGVVCLPPGKADAMQAAARQFNRNRGKVTPFRRPDRDPASPCPTPVNFSRLEGLWPEMHFRGPLHGPKSYFKRIPPHLLGKHANFSACQRKVYLDIGARTFEDGLLPMLQLYPELGAFDEFYLFEAVAGFYKLPPPRKLAQVLGRYMPPDRVASFVRRHFFFQTFIGSLSDPSTVPPTIGLSDFLTTTLQLTPADAVVVKMDVEGYEYGLVEHLLGDGAAALIDELFLEVHYGHLAMRRAFNWCRTWQFWCNYTLEDATNMYQTLRDAGIYAHHWP